MSANYPASRDSGPPADTDEDRGILGVVVGFLVIALFCWPIVFGPEVELDGCRVDTEPGEGLVAEVTAGLLSWHPTGSLDVDATVQVHQGSETVTAVSAHADGVSFWDEESESLGPVDIELPLDPVKFPPRCEVTDLDWS